MAAEKNDSYDAIVVGTGISGGWAAKELTEKGLKTLVLDRGRMVRHGEYPTATKDLWELPYGGRATQDDLERQAVAARTGYVVSQASKHWFVDDVEHPYTEVKRFDWVRGYHVGGRSIMWGRQTYRWSPMDFEANARDGVAVDWPIRYSDVEPWYDHVERFIGVSGQAEGLPQLPDSQFLPPMELNCVEKHLKQLAGRKIRSHADDRPRRASHGAARTQSAARYVSVSATCASAVVRTAPTSAATRARCPPRKRRAT